MGFYENTGVVLEGGGSRGVFTAGVLDYFMQRGLKTSYVVGVSAGACNAVDYVSEQPGRTKKCTIIRDKALEYASVKNLARKRSFFDMDLIFDRFPNELIPFDYETYFENVNNDISCEIVTTNCLTGKSVYWDTKSDGKRLMDTARASSSMPLLSPVVYIDSVPYLDGAIADSVPIGRSLRKGNKKNIVVLTKEKGYRKGRTGKNYARLIIQRYKKYPEFCRAAIHRNEMYDRQMSIIDRLEEEGRIFVIRPTMKPVSRTERNADILDEFYQNGLDTAEERFNDIIGYLNR
ncbi:MAG: patatin family protein [Lachnospiraceae bacterium]|nr:patatin family protein [Lachnospiraceae bacterium]